jgi:hypothetical protein
MQAKARIQINLMLSKVDDIKQVAGIPEIVYPLFWFESVRNLVIDFVLTLFFNFLSYSRVLIRFRQI